MAASIDFTYKYSFASEILTNSAGKPVLSLATCDSNQAHPHFFDGRVLYPRIMGDMLITLTDVVRSHFFLPRPTNLDPVLTSNEELLRLEGFSGCCGVYARVDLPTPFFEGDLFGRGTTNVDFNTPMRNALMRLRDNEDVQFSVGNDGVELTKGNQRTIEKKVKLPLRWIKGFSEVQAYQPSLELAMEVGAADALRFVRSLPKTAKSKMPSYVISMGRSIRLSQRKQKDAVRLVGAHRVKVIEPLLVRAKSLRIWRDEANGTSAWEVCFNVGSFFLMISPEVYRGFSGEGQVLSKLANPPSDEVIAQVRAQLKWQSCIDIKDMSNNLKIDAHEIRSSLAVLGSRGLAGFDATSQMYFHRELPFDLSKVEDLQPRLKQARKLAKTGEIQTTSDKEGELVYVVPGTGTRHRVRLSDSDEVCTCPWFSKYQGARGPCKHILAVQLIIEGSDS
ncbi:SWIM zinc finger family protein [uncultured Pseudoteredinibacter sp.]|uniref:SWIM zinc finger family protein n=1 Tax=uncultured Pseudoteredinibacter sp. TaxID=1641701 RepID=UPI002616D92F|nr:SWIM zinc finger family protein [uncultured Pseudoteredinibacter sp.]